MKIYWNGTSKNIIGSKIKQLRIEQGSRFIPDCEVAILAEYFNISSDELLGTKESEQ